MLNEFPSPPLPSAPLPSPLPPPPRFNQVGTFSLVKKSTEVLALPFARWVRSLAFLPKDKGTLFRSKAVLAVAGSDLKLVFHAVSDVMER